MRFSLIIILMTVFLFSCNSADNKTGRKQLKADSVKPDTDDTNVMKPVKDSVSSKFKFKFSVLPPLFFHGKGSTLMAETPQTDTSIYTTGSYNNITYRGYVCLTEMNFSGDNVPFVCTVSKNIKALYIDGKRIRFKPEQEFFFRQEIPLYLGYNRIPVKIINKRREQTESYIEINMVSIK